MSEIPYFGLPGKVLFCRCCVISNQRPNSTVEMKNKENIKTTIEFSEDGICSACEYNEKKNEINWKEREALLFEMLEPYRKNNGEYDVLVPSSGGKDSSFTAHILKYKYGMNPLAVTWAPNIFTDIGWSNFNNLTRVGGIDSYLYTPNGKVHSLVTRLAFENLGHPFQPFIHGQKIIGPKIASSLGIQLIMYGENQAEYGNPIEDNKSPFMVPDFFTIEDPYSIHLGGISIREIMNSYGLQLSDFSAYIPPTPQQVIDANIKVSFLGYFEKWDPQECYYYSVENTGFSAAPKRSIGTYSKYTEIDDKMVAFHFYMAFIKFGIGRATYDAAQEIRNKKITREEGVILVDKYDGEFPLEYLDEFLAYTGLSSVQFNEIVDKFRSPHLWKKEGDSWLLRHNVAKQGSDD